MTWKCTNTPKGENKLYSDAKGVVPSLDLRFAEGKNLNDYMTGQNLITFSRPVGANQSPGTYVDENGIIQLSSADTPRFDHDPTTGESLGLLIEESRTNVQWFDPLSSVLSSASVDGPTGNSANVYERAATNETAAITVQTNWTQDNGMVLSFFVKKQGNGRYFKVHPQGQLFGNAKWTYDYDTKTIVENNLFSFSVDELPNGWHRIKVVSSPVVRTSAHILGISVHSALPTSGTNLDTGLLYGIQLETGSFPTSYIPTTGTALTRSADVASITGSNFSSWYNPNQGTIYAKNTYQGTGIQKSFWTLKDSLNNSTDYIGLVVKTSGQLRAASNKAGALQLFLNGIGAITEGDNVHTAVALQENNCAFCTDGGSVLPDTTVLLSDNLERLLIGYLYDPTVQQLTGHIARLTYFPERLPDSSLQTMTTP